MKELVIRKIVLVIILITVLLVQRLLSNRRQFFALTILPILSLLGGIVYCMKNDGISINNYLPFLILSVCLLVSGLLERTNFKKKELEKMKKIDLIDKNQ